MEKYFNEIQKNTKLYIGILGVGIGKSFNTTSFKQEFFYRFFEDILNTEQIKKYVTIVKEVNNWVNNNEFTDFIYVEEPTEIGVDYVKIPHEQHQYFRSIIEIKDEIEEIEEDQNEFDTELHKEMERHSKILKKILPYYEMMPIETKKQQILKRIIYKSIIIPSNGTYFVENKIIVFEPIITKEDVLAWN